MSNTIKIVQILSYAASYGNELYGLDEVGQLWVFNWNSNNWIFVSEGPEER